MNRNKLLRKQSTDDYLIHLHSILGSVFSILTIVDSGDVFNPVRTWM